MRSIPSSAEGADQADARAELPRLEVDGGALVGEQCGFGRKHLKVAGDAAFVALVGEIEGVLRGCDSALFDAGLLFQNSQAGELVFDVVEGVEDGVSVSGSLGLVGVAGLAR